MQPSLRKSLPTRIAACGFIAVILFGNLWLTYALLGQPVPSWMRNGFALGICVTLVAAVALLALAAHLKLKGGRSDDETAEDRGS